MGIGDKMCALFVVSVGSSSYRVELGLVVVVVVRVMDVAVKYLSQTSTMSRPQCSYGWQPVVLECWR
jgi:hypothetical protein